MRRQDYDKRESFMNNGGRGEGGGRGDQFIGMGAQQGEMGVLGGVMSNQGGGILGGNQGSLLGDHGSFMGGNQGGLLGQSVASLMGGQAGGGGGGGSLMNNPDLMAGLNNSNLLNMIKNCGGLSGLLGQLEHSQIMNLAFAAVKQGNTMSPLLGDPGGDSDYRMMISEQAGPPPDGGRGVASLFSSRIDGGGRRFDVGNQFKNDNDMRSDDLRNDRFQISGHQSNASFRSDDPFKSNKDGFCDRCNRPYFDSYMLHCQTPDHKKRARLVHRGCMLCETGKFKNYTEYVLHLQTTKHKQKKDQLNKYNEMKKFSRFALNKNNDNSRRNNEREDDTKSKISNEKNFTGFMKLESKYSVNVRHGEGEGRRKKDDERGRGKDEDTEGENEESAIIILDDKMKTDDADDKISFPLVYDPDVAVGQEHVIIVTGYFCQLCRKFYNNETMAKVTHCKSEIHFEKFEEEMKLK